MTMSAGCKRLAVLRRLVGYAYLIESMRFDVQQNFDPKQCGFGFGLGLGSDSGFGSGSVIRYHRRQR